MPGDGFGFGWFFSSNFFFGVKVYGCFPKIVGFPPKSSILIGFSIIFTIPFGGKIPLFSETPVCLHSKE